MYAKTSDATRTRTRSVMGRFPSRILERHLDDDVAGVAAAVDGLLHHLEQLLQDDQLLRVARPVVEAAQLLQHHLVGLALGELEPVVGLADGIEGASLAQLLYHERERVGGLAHELGLAAEHLVGNAPRIDGEALDDLLHLLRDPVEGDRQGLEVLAVKGGDEGPAQGLVHQVADALLLAPGLGEVVEPRRLLSLVHLAQESREQVHAHPRLLGARLQQVEEHVVFPNQFLEEIHGRRLLRSCYDRGDEKGPGAIAQTAPRSLSHRIPMASWTAYVLLSSDSASHPRSPSAKPGPALDTKSAGQAMKSTPAFLKRSAARGICQADVTRATLPPPAMRAKAKDSSSVSRAVSMSVIRRGSTPSDSAARASTEAWVGPPPSPGPLTT